MALPGISKYFKDKLSKKEKEALEFKEQCEQRRMEWFDPAVTWISENDEQRRARWKAEFEKKRPQETIGFSGNWGRSLVSAVGGPNRPSPSTVNPWNPQASEQALEDDITNWLAVVEASKKRRLEEEKKEVARLKRQKTRQDLYDRLGGQLLYRPKGVEDQ